MPTLILNANSARYTVSPAVEFECKKEPTDWQRKFYSEGFYADAVGEALGLAPPEGLRGWNPAFRRVPSELSPGLAEFGITRALRVVPANVEMHRWEKVNCFLQAVAGREVALTELDKVSKSGSTYVRSAAIAGLEAVQASGFAFFYQCRVGKDVHTRFDDELRARRIDAILEEYKLEWGDLADDYSRGGGNITQQGGLIRVSDHPMTDEKSHLPVAASVLTEGRSTQASLDNVRNYLRRVKTAAAEVREVLKLTPDQLKAA